MHRDARIQECLEQHRRGAPTALSISLGASSRDASATSRDRRISSLVFCTLSLMDGPPIDAPAVTAPGATTRPIRKSR